MINFPLAPFNSPTIVVLQNIKNSCEDLLKFSELPLDAKTFESIVKTYNCLVGFFTVKEEDK